MDRVKTLQYNLVRMGLPCISKQKKTKLLTRVLLVSYINIFLLIHQSVNLFPEIAMKNFACVFVCFYEGCKNNFWL